MQTDWALLKNLIIKSQSGDKKAYKQFLEALRPWIDSKVRFKVFNPGDCPDITQEILISIHKSLATFDNSYELKPWVFAICQRRIIDYIRRTSRNQEVFVENSEDAVTNHIGQTNIESVREEFELLSELPENLLRPIWLTKIMGHSTYEAAQILNIKENALRTRLSRAYKLIEKKLNNEESLS